mmetsp:Transcript_26266/g.49916  ORF Transcript_26266/g.49916 Transcript_26266/m.49916 type:complete len:213 (+) Transcript_26266:52-690(+)
MQYGKDLVERFISHSAIFSVALRLVHHPQLEYCQPHNRHLQSSSHPHLPSSYRVSKKPKQQPPHPSSPFEIYQDRESIYHRSCEDLRVRPHPCHYSLPRFHLESYHPHSSPWHPSALECSTSHPKPLPNHPNSCTCTRSQSSARSRTAYPETRRDLSAPDARSSSRTPRTWRSWSVSGTVRSALGTPGRRSFGCGGGENRIRIVPCDQSFGI